MKINIAIDGPAGSGKSSIGQELANKLGYTFIDTGLTYRAFTYWCATNNIDFSNEEEIKQVLDNFNYRVEGNSVYVNDVDVTKYLQSDIVTNNINKLTGLIYVRTKMVEIQRSLAVNKGTVMVGRDITSIVLPDAELKIYLEADLDVRSMRRFIQLKGTVDEKSFEEIKNSLNIRDHSDMTRKHGPLVKVEDAISIDSSHITKEEAVNKIIKLVEKIIKK